MLIFDFFAGTGSATKAFEDAGHKVIKIELDQRFEADERDILKLNAEYLISKYGQPDFIWASPPCTTFSVASCRIYWHYVDGKLTPKDDRVHLGISLVKQALKLIKELNPQYGWVLENPRGMLRKQEFMQNLPRRTITYCQYGDYRMKPTDLWGEIPGWISKAPCKPKNDCHEKAARGTARGTQRLRAPHLRSMLPYGIGLEICDAVHKAQNTPKEQA